MTLLEMSDHILIREDPDAAAIVQAAMTRDGVRVVVKCGIERVEREGAEKVIHFTCDGAHRVAVDEILVGAGRAPNTEGLGLDAAGVNHDRKGVTDFLDDYSS